MACLLGLLALPPARAQEQAQFDAYSVDEGLPQSSVWSILQDRQGFLWIGTADGVCRYDGYAFQKIEPISGAAIKGLVRLYEDRHGDIWIAHQHGILRYQTATGRMKELYAVRNTPAGELSHKILGEDPAGRLWIALAYGELICIAPETGKVVGRFHPPADKDLFFDGYIDRNGQIWMISPQHGITRYNIRTNEWQRYGCGIGGYMMLPLSDTLLLATEEDGPIYFNTHTGKMRPIDALKNLPSRAVTLADAVLDGQGQIWICTDHGIFVFNPKTAQITQHLASFGTDKGYDYVYTALCDRSGNMWIGTNGDGLKKLIHNTKQFYHYIYPTPGGSVVKSICLRDSLIYTGLFRNGIQVFHWRTGFVKQLNVLPHNSTAYAIIPFDTNRLLVYGAGFTASDLDIGLLDTRNFRYTRITPQMKEALPAVDFDRTSNYSFALQQGERDVLVGQTDKLIRITQNEKRALHFTVVHSFDVLLSCAYRDGDGRLYVGSLNGFFRQEENGWSHYKLSGNVHVKTICTDAFGNIWVGTTTGLYLFQKSGKLLAYITSRNGLKNDFIYGLLRDARGRIWGSHNKGISMYDPATNRIRHFGKEDGLQSNEFNTGAYARGAGSALLFGGINGVNAFLPDSIISNPVAPQVYITGITLFDKPLKTDTAYEHLSAITLPYDQNSLGFEFAALEYTASPRNQYVYKLEGVDADWISAGNKRSTRYPALPPGSYVFSVRASNNDGLWSATPRNIRITILPPFWKTIWFQSLLVLAGIGGLAGILWQWQRRHYRKELRRLELQRQIQTERERISRDLHDNVGTQLSLISNNIAWIASPERKVSSAEQAQKLGYIVGVAQEVITTLRDTIWALNREQITLEELGDKLKVFVSRQLAGDASDVRLQFEEEGTDSISLGPSEALHLFRICQEVVANALKYAHATVLHIAIAARPGNGYAILIKDNGKGFDTGAAAAGYGLDNMRFRAAEINCGLSIVSQVGEGTTVSMDKMVQMQ